MSVGLRIEHLVAGYGETVVLDGISLDLPPRGTLAILGRNGVGKTTLLATLMGITTRHGGTIRLGDVAIEAMPVHKRARLGLGLVRQEREIFPSLTVEENLVVSALPGGWNIDAVFELFPPLKARRRNTGNRLSGGEQQMLAIGRALVGGPKVLLLDEPLEGLAPVASARRSAERLPNMAHRSSWDITRPKPRRDNSQRRCPLQINYTRPERPLLRIARRLVCSRPISTEPMAAATSW